METGKRDKYPFELWSSFQFDSQVINRFSMLHNKICKNLFQKSLFSYVEKLDPFENCHQWKGTALMTFFHATQTCSNILPRIKIFTCMKSNHRISNTSTFSLLNAFYFSEVLQNLFNLIQLLRSWPCQKNSFFTLNTLSNPIYLKYNTIIVLKTSHFFRQVEYNNHRLHVEYTHSIIII